MKDLNIEEKQHINDVATRWGSKRKMLQRVKDLLPASNQVFLTDAKYRDLSVNWEEADTMDSVLRALDGFQYLTDVLSADKEVTVSSYIPLLRHIYQLTTSDDDDDDTSKEIKQVIRDYFHKKLSTHMEQNDKDLLMFLRIAELLDPRYLSVAVAEEDEAQEWMGWPAKDAVKAHVINETKHIIEGRDNRDDVVTTTTTPQSAREDFQSPEKKKTKSLVSLLLSTQSQNNNAQEDAPQQTTRSIQEKLSLEYEFYIRLSADMNADVLEWWSRHAQELPSLAKLARYYFTACSTSGPSERLFSLSGNIVSKKRNALKPSMVNQLVFLSFNREMIL